MPIRILPQEWYEPQIPAGILGGWDLVLACWSAWEIAGGLAPFWLPPEALGRPAVLAILAVGWLLVAAAAIWDSTARNISSSRGWALVATMLVGVAFAAVGAVAYGMAVVVPSAIVACLTVLEHRRSRRRFRSREREFQSRELFMASPERFWSIFHVAQSIAYQDKRTRFYFDPANDVPENIEDSDTFALIAAPTERPGTLPTVRPAAQLHWRTYTSDDTKHDGIAGVRNNREWASVCDWLMHIGEVRPKFGDGKEVVQTVVDVDPVDWLQAYAEGFPAVVPPIVEMLPRRVRLHMTFEPTVFGSNVEITYEYLNDRASEAEYRPARRDC